MDYMSMSKEELIREIRALRTASAYSQDGELTSADYIIEGSIIPRTAYQIQSELFCRFSPDLQYTFVNEAYTKFFKEKHEYFIGESIVNSLPEEYHDVTINILLGLSPQNPVATAEYSWACSNRQIRWRRWTVRAIYDENDNLIEYHAVGHDVSEHKKAEAEIQHRLKIERAIAQASKLLVCSQEADLDEMLRVIGEAIAVNRVYIFEFRDNLCKVDNTYEWCDENTRSEQIYLQNLDTALFSWGLGQFAQGDTIVISDRNALPPEASNEIASMEVQDVYAALLVPINGIDDKLLGYIGFDNTEQSRQWQAEDIQCLQMLAEMLGAYWERKKFENALRASETQFRTLADMAPAMIFVYGQPIEEAPLRYLNNGYQFITGYDKEESINKCCWDFVHPEFIELCKTRAYARLKGESAPSRYELKFQTRDGESRWGDLSVSTIEWESQTSLMGVVYDITERKQIEEKLMHTYNQLESRVIERTSDLQKEIAERQRAEKALMLSETRYRAIVEDQCELVLRALPDSTITFVNEAYCRTFSKKAEELIGQSLIPFIYKEDRAKFAFKINSFTPEYLDEVHTLRAVKENGEICWHEWTAHAIVKDEKIIEFQAVGRDVSKRKQAEEALRLNEANFRRLADKAPALIYVYSEGRFLYVNSTFERITEQPKEKLLSMNTIDLAHEDYRELIMNNALARQKGEKISPYEVSMIGKNGQQLWGYLYADTIDYEGQPAILGMIVDATEHKKLEESLLQASKLESLGILAGGIAHDFNNILTVISGNISLAKVIMNTDKEAAELLNEVEKATFQACALTQQLLTFSKGGAPIKETATIQELLQESATFVLRGSNVSCHYTIDAALWSVNIDKGQISQVINNLIINADQAMPEGGLIQLSAENLGTGSDYPPSLTPGNYIKISIKDSGTGIAEKDLFKVFDPYFTTKKNGHGLGLPTCYSIIKKHDGDINISSRIGVGTTVNIYLPAFPDQSVETRNLPRLDLNGQGKILIMDDEAIVRETLSKILQRLGYSINTASDGLKAIHLYQTARQANEPYDAVLMDLTIAGGMGGKEAVKKILEIDPEAKVIVSSGYSNDPVMSDFKNYGFSGILPKPYEIHAINKILYELLGKEHAS